jgi:Zn-dependent oligopeptidase
MLAETAERNAKFLGFAHNTLQMLRRLDDAPDQIRGLLSGFVEQVRKLREEKPDNLMAAIETLLSDFLEEGKQKLKG